MRSLGGYTLLERFASGPSSEIYIASDDRAGSGAFSAVKLLRPRLARDPLFVDAMMRDARASAFRHRCAVEIHDVVSVDGEVLIVEELIKARSLAEVLERGEMEKKPLARELVLWIGVEVAGMLDTLHRTDWPSGEPMWHGALSPFDVMIEESGRIRVLGCGLGRARNVVAPALDRLPYVAPEVIEEDAPGPLSDIYALAVMIYDALLGGRVFRRASVAETRAAIVRGEAPRMASRTDWANAIIDELLAQSMARWPESRPQSVAYVERALKSQLRGTDESMRGRLAEHLRRLFAVELEAFERSMDAARRRVKVAPPEALHDDPFFGGDTEPMQRLEPPAPDPEISAPPEVGAITEPQRVLIPPSPNFDQDDDLLRPADLLADLFESIEDGRINLDPSNTEPVPLVRPVSAAKPPPLPRGASLSARATTSGAAEVAGAPARFFERLQVMLPRYELGAEIAKAGPISGIEAHARDSRAPVLIIALDLERMDDARLPREEWVAIFDRICSIARKVTLPTLPRLLESAAQGSVRFAVLDHAEGASLSLVIGRGKVLGVEPVRKIIASAAVALQHLHERGILFCNVHAHGVWLTREGQGRLIDFSMAAAIGGPLNPLLPSNVFALAPEYLKNGEFTPASDQFALGALLYELLTQTRPFRGLDTAMILAAIREKEPLSPHTIDSRVDRLLSDVAMRALDKDPRRRFNSLAELARLVTSS